MVRAGAGSWPAARASGAVFRSGPTTTVMAAAHQGAAETAVTEVERSGMTYMAATRNWNLAPPSASSIKTLRRRIVQARSKFLLSLPRQRVSERRMNQRWNQRQSTDSRKPCATGISCMVRSLPPQPASAAFGPVPKAAKKARKQQAFANSPLVSTFPFRCVGRPNYRKSPANSANIPVFGRPRLETWFDHHCQVRRAAKKQTKSG